MIKKQQTDAEKCEKCGGALTKAGVMESGNSKYAQFHCKACGHTQLKCEGLMAKGIKFS